MKVQKKHLPFYVGTLLLMVFLAFSAARFITSHFGSQSRYPVREDFDAMLSEKIFHPNWPPSDLAELAKNAWVQTPFLFEKDTLILQEQPFASKYVNISDQGYRVIKNQAPWPPPKDGFTIFVFGGSTTFGYGVADDETIPSYLQEELRKSYPASKINVYNFGRGFYNSAAEKYLFETLLERKYVFLEEKHVPDLAIFIDGINDVYVDDQLSVVAKGTIAAIMGQHISVNSSRLTDVLGEDNMRLASEHIGGNTSGTSENISLDYATSSDVVDPQFVIDRWLRSKTAIEQLASKHGVKTLWVWQPTPVYKYDLSYHIFMPKSGMGRNGKGAHVYPVMEKEAPQIKSTLWLGSLLENAKEPLFMDLLHYSPKLNGMVAHEIVKHIDETSLLK